MFFNIFMFAINLCFFCLNLSNLFTTDRFWIKIVSCALMTIQAMLIIFLGMSIFSAV